MRSMLRPAVLALIWGVAVALLAAPLPARADADDATALAVFETGLAEACSDAFDAAGRLRRPVERYEMQSPNSWGDGATAVTLWMFECGRGAYHVNNVFVKKTEVEGITLVHFAAPDLDVTRVDPEDYDSAVLRIEVDGWSSSAVVTNGSFDPETLEISEYAAWRSSGDASNAAVWRLINENFSLRHYAVDASYDGEMNPETIIDFK